jgi:hypothetical protein
MVLWLGTLNTRADKLQQEDQSSALTSTHRPKRESSFTLRLFWDLGEADNGGGNVIFAPEWIRGGGGKIRILNCGKTLIPPVLKL